MAGPRLSAPPADCSRTFSIRSKAEQNRGEDPDQQRPSSALPSTLTLLSKGSAIDPWWARYEVMAKANPRPSTAPMLESIRLSVSSWRISRPRPAPSALRMANSLLRAAARASSRFERFTQTISRIRPTAHQSTISDRRNLPLTWSFRAGDGGFDSVLQSGFALVFEVREQDAGFGLCLRSPSPRFQTATSDNMCPQLRMSSMSRDEKSLFSLPARKPCRSRMLREARRRR